MKHLVLVLAFCLSSLAFGASAPYAPLYNSGGTLTGILVTSGNTVLPVNNNNDSGYQAFIAWLAAQTPPVTLQQWLAANPWQSWGTQTLAQFQAQQLAQCETQGVMYFMRKYPQHRQMQFMGLLVQAQAKGWTNCVAYINKLWTYQMAIMQIYGQAAAAINAATTCQQVQAVTWNYASVETTCPDPLVTVAAAAVMQN